MGKKLNGIENWFTPIFNRFAINFRTGSDDGSDIAFHFNPRLQENCTIRNSCSGGNWGGEERDQPEFPFELKDTCEIAIQAQPDRFVVSKFRVNL